jgi:hypothetical protein
MECKRRVTVHWGVLLIVYLAILFATSMVVLTSGSVDGYYVLLLVAGLPIYFVASKAIMCDEDGGLASSKGLQDHAIDSNVVAFPDHPAKLPTDIGHLRKLG